LDFADALTSTGSVHVRAGTLAAPAGYTQSAGSTIVEGTFTADRLDIQGGTLSGTGTIIADVSNSAQVLPGVSPRVLTINGNYTQTPSGLLVLEINGDGAGAGHDQLRVIGSVNLAGTLAHVCNFAPFAGDRFILLDNGLAEAITGTFD